MSINGTRDTNTIPKVKVPAFLKLWDSIVEKTGSVRAASELTKVAIGTIYPVKSGHRELSVTTAQRIMTAYKSLKETK